MNHDYKSALDAIGCMRLIENRSVKHLKGTLYYKHYETIRAALQLAQEAEKPKGEISDGYHTFNELYEHRHSLFCALTKAYPEKSWKSKLHSDGTMFDGWFIAGIETIKGNATYHLPISWWECFEIDELPTAMEWDGHTSIDVINRIKTLSPKKVMVIDGHGDLIDPQEFYPCQECKIKDEHLDIIRDESKQLRKERDELAAAVLDMDVKMESYGIYTGRTQDVIELAKKVSENGNA